MTRHWEALLHGSERDQALEIVANIATALTGHPEASDYRGLMGPIGGAIFLSSAHAAGIGDDLAVLEALERGLAELGQGAIPLGLWNGAAGIRWAISQLTTGADSAALLARLDSQIEGQLLASDCDGYDLYSGLAGVLLAYADDDLRGKGLDLNNLVA